jgi:hypothetical protein
MMGSANSANAGQQHPANSTQPANHSEPVIDAWYLVNHITRSLSPYYVLTRGFDITSQEYDAGHAMVSSTFLCLFSRGLILLSTSSFSS